MIRAGRRVCMAVLVAASVFPRPAWPQADGSPWRTLFFENDFSVVKASEEIDVFGEECKDVPLGCPPAASVSVGGELRFRHMNENNRLRPGGPGRSTYDLWRWRQYVDYWRGDLLRLYVESIHADSFGEDLPTQLIDVNRWDLLNAFADVVVSGERGGEATVLRVGRQELLYGSQHLVSPLDWANTRRNFSGVKLFRRTAAWDLDAFVTRPVNLATGRPDRQPQFESGFDRPDWSRTFSGVYGVYRGVPDHVFDVYWLWLREQEPIAGVPDGNRHTVGLRWQHRRPFGSDCDEPPLVWASDVQGAYQFGRDNGLAVSAGFFAGDLGVTFERLSWKPTLKALYYFGSGDRDPDDRRDNTFSFLFPLAHAYWGIIDNVGGQNLHNYSLQMLARPTASTSLVAQYHWFDLASDQDFIYNVVGRPIGARGAGRKIGEELDLIGTWTLSPNFDVQVGYSWFWYGSAVLNSPLRRDDATQLYVQTHFRY